MTLGDWLVLAGNLVLAVLVTLACLDAHRSARRSERCRYELQSAVELLLMIARAGLDHESADKLAAGVTWSPRDHLGKTPKTAAPGRAFPSSARPGPHPPPAT